MKCSLPVMACVLSLAPLAFAAPKLVAPVRGMSPQPAPAAATKTTVAKGITEVTLQIMPGYVRAPAPVYKVVFYADGRALAIKGDQEHPQRYTGTLGEPEFKRLTEFIEQSKFFALAPLYTVGISDASTVATSVVKNGQRKDVHDYAHQGPAQLWALETVVRGLDAQVTWHPVPPAKK